MSDFGFNNLQVIAIICLYLTALMYIGFRGFKKTKTFEDYVLGSRQLGSVVGAMNVGASDMSSWVFMALPSVFFLYGISQIWMVIGLIIGSYLSWKIIAKRLRKYTEIANNSLTLSAFLDYRFNDKSNMLRIITSVVIIVFFSIYIASGFVGSAKLLSGFFGIEYHTSLILSCIAIMFYALLGGFLAVSWADLFQGILMLFALVAVPVIIFYNIESNPITFLQHNISTHLDLFYNMNLGGFVSIVAWGLGYFGQPHIISKYMAIQSCDIIPSARRICLYWMTVIMISAACIGLFGRVYFYNEVINEPETIFMISIAHFCHPIVIGILISALLSSIMSTINGQVLLCCSSLTEDIYKKFFRQNASNKEMLIVARLCVVITAIIGILISINAESSVLGLVSHAWAGFGASFGPVILFSLFWKKTTKYAAISGILSGGVGTIIFAKTSYFSYEILPAFILSSLCIYLVSIFTKQDNYDQIKKDFEIIGKV